MLGMLVMEAFTLLLSGNGNNASVFRECGGARCAHNLVPYPECRQQVLGNEVNTDELRHES
ncbi:WD repeat and FYVE domain-containing protein 3 [Blattella germanica]|nr:WD repeat and FYVE domain-containing protein 3 [Blattella germanica]